MTRSAPAKASAASIPHVNIGWLHPFFEILDERGTPRGELLERARLPILSAEEGATLVPTSHVYDFVALATEQTRLPDLGLRAGSRFNLAPLLPTPEGTWSRPGVFRTLEGFIEGALESSSNVDMWIERRSDQEHFAEFFYLGTFDRRHPAFRTVEQFMLVLMVRLVRYAAWPGWNPTQVNLRATSVPEGPMRRVVGGAEIRSAQEVTSIAFASSQFAGPVHALPAKSSPVWKQRRRWLHQRERQEDIAASLRIVLPAYLPDGSASIEQAARLARMSVRSLQRRLKEHGLTYSELLDELRHDLAIYLLRDRSRPVSQVSQTLGYREPAIFTRAFRRWTGQSPTSFRQSLRS